MNREEIKPSIAKRVAKELHDGDVVNLGIGLVTPPVGMNLYVAASLKKAGVEDVVCKHLWCYILCCLVVLALLVLFPGIVTFLPNLMK